MKFLSVVDSIQMEGMLSQICDIGPSFFDIYSLFHKMKNDTSIKILRHHHEKSKFFGQIVTEIFTIKKMV